MADPEGVQGGGGGSNRLFHLYRDILKMRDRLQIDPLPTLSESVVDPPSNKKAYVDISDITGKPTEALEGHFYLLVITYYLQLITYHLFTTYYLLLITYYLSLITYYLLLIISFLTPITAGNSNVHSL